MRTAGDQESRRDGRETVRKYLFDEHRKERK